MDNKLYDLYNLIIDSTTQIRDFLNVLESIVATLSLLKTNTIDPATEAFLNTNITRIQREKYTLSLRLERLELEATELRGQMDATHNL